MDCLAPADSLKRFLLQHTQQFGLHVQAQLTNLIEENSPAVGYFEPPFATLLRTGVCTPFTAEELALYQIFIECGAVDRDKGLVGALAALMNHVRHHLFSGSTFSGNQYRRHRPSDGHRFLPHFAGSVALPDQTVRHRYRVDVLLQAMIFPADLCQLLCLCNIHNQLIDIRRFYKVCVGSFFHRIHCAGDRALRRQHDDLSGGPVLLNPQKNLHPIHFRHDNIQDHHRYPASRHEFQRGGSVVRRMHLKSLQCEYFLIDAKQFPVVIHQKYRIAFHFFFLLSYPQRAHRAERRTLLVHGVSLVVPSLFVRGALAKCECCRAERRAFPSAACRLSSLRCSSAA